MACRVGVEHEFPRGTGCPRAAPFDAPDATGDGGGEVVREHRTAHAVMGDLSRRVGGQILEGDRDCNRGGAGGVETNCKHLAHRPRLAHSPIWYTATEISEHESAPSTRRRRCKSSQCHSALLRFAPCPPAECIAFVMLRNLCAGVPGPGSGVALCMLNVRRSTSAEGGHRLHGGPGSRSGRAALDRQPLGAPAQHAAGQVGHLRETAARQQHAGLG